MPKNNGLNSQDELQLTIQVTRLYFEQELTQQEIAKRLGITRQKVSRLLEQARNEGIVRITIHDPTPVDSHLADQLKKTFNLKEVILASSEGLSSEKLRVTLGMSAARYVTKNLPENAFIGISWGRTLNEMVNAFHPGSDKRDIQVIPLVGGMGGIGASFQVNEISRRFAESFGGSYRMIHVPAFTKDPVLLKALMRTPDVKEIKALWERLEIAIVGIGHVEFQKFSPMFFHDYISAATLAELEAIGGVGDICGHFFNLDGGAVGTDAISIDLQLLKSIPQVIGIAGGVEKVRAIFGALRGGYIKTLITDTVTARSIIDEYVNRVKNT